MKISIIDILIFHFFNPEAATQDEVSTLSECYNPQESFHPQAAYPRKSGAAGREGCPPCPESLSLLAQSYR